MRQLGDLGEAQRQAERIIELRSGNQTRSRAFGQLILVTVLIGLGKPGEACAVARDVLNATQSLGSFLVIQQLQNLKQLLEPHRPNKVVADFLGCVDPKHKPDWDMPGGMAEANEPPHQAVQREREEELGLTFDIGEMLCVDRVASHGPWEI